MFSTDEVRTPDFFEVNEFITSDKIYPCISWMSESQKANYVIKSFPRDRIFRINEHSEADSDFWQNNSDEFERHGLVSHGEKIPLDVLISNQSNAKLIQLINEFGGNSSPRRNDNEKTLHRLASENSDTQQNFRESVKDEFLRCKMPPSGLSWEEFQSYRWQIRGMTGTLFYLFESPDQLKFKFPTLYASLVNR